MQPTQNYPELKILPQESKEGGKTAEKKRRSSEELKTINNKLELL